MNKQRANKLLSLFLSLTILLSCAGFQAYADEPSPPETLSEAVPEVQYETLTEDQSEAAPEYLYEDAAPDETQNSAASADLYFIEEDRNIENGVIHLESTTYSEGDMVTVRTEPDAGRVTASFTAMMSDDDNPRDYTHEIPGLKRPDPDTLIFPMPAANVFLSATFSDYGQLRVFICDMEGGTVVADLNLVEPWSDVTLTIEPENGYRYVEDSLRAVMVDSAGYEHETIPEPMTENSVYMLHEIEYSVYVSAEFTEDTEGEEYHVFINPDGEEPDKGTVIADPEDAEAGWTVTLTPVPKENSNYALETLTVKDENGIEIPTEQKEDGTCTFIMPEGDAFVWATFAIPAYSVTSVSEDVDIPGGDSADSTGCTVMCSAEEAEAGDTVIVQYSLPLDTELVSLEVTGDETGRSYDIELTSHNEGSTAYFYKFTMPGEPVTVHAAFTFIRFAILADETVRGGLYVTVEGETLTGEDMKARRGKTVTVINTSGKSILTGLTMSYERNGRTYTSKIEIAQGGGPVYTGTFEMPEAEVTLSAEYIMPYRVIPDEEATGYAITADPERADEGDIVTVTLSAPDVFETVAWKGVYADANGGTRDVVFTSDPENAAKATFVMPAGDVTVSATFTLKPIHYINEEGRDKVCEEYVPMSSLEDVEGLTLDNIWPELNNLESEKWYVVDKDLTFENRIYTESYDNCPVHIILCDGVTLTAKKGIGNNRDNCLIINGQSGNTGTLKCFTGSEPGSVVPAPLGGDENQDGGHLIICGGTVYATSDHEVCPAIGCGTPDDNYFNMSSFADNCGEIEIRGGKVYATSNGYAPAIGCSYATVTQDQSKNGGTVRITGGYVEARANNKYSYNAIGALNDESIALNDVSITGGTVIACTLGTTWDGRAALNTDGGVTIGDDMRVTAGYNEDETAVLKESGERVTACQTNRYVKIEVCPHKDPAFEISKAGHIIHCANCTVGGGGIMPHTFEDDFCTVCGYHGFTVTFLPGEGTGSMNPFIADPGESMPLPDAGAFSAPEYKKFKEWSVAVGDEEPVCYSPGEEFNVTADTTVTAVWDYEPHIATVNGVSGSFRDKINLNFYFEFSRRLEYDKDAVVIITNKSTGRSVTESVYYADYESGKGYKFSFPLAAKEASDTVTAQVFDGQGNKVKIIGADTGEDYTETGAPCTLMKYFDWLKNNGEDDEEKALGVAARDYCTAAQIYFKYNADGLGVSDAVGKVTADMLDRYISRRLNELPEGVIIRGLSVMLESDNTLRLYLSFKDVDPYSFSYSVNGDDVELNKRSDGMYYIKPSSGVWPNKLQDEIDFVISDSTNSYSYTITASVLTYARACARKPDKAVSDLGKALYLYNLAAIDKFGQ